jgi:hypothetical protein
MTQAFAAKNSFLLSDRAVPVNPAAFKKAVAHHAVAEQ